MLKLIEPFITVNQCAPAYTWNDNDGNIWTMTIILERCLRKVADICCKHRLTIGWAKLSNWMILFSQLSNYRLRIERSIRVSLMVTPQEMWRGKFRYVPCYAATTNIMLFRHHIKDGGLTVPISVYCVWQCCRLLITTSPRSVHRQYLIKSYLVTRLES